MNTLAKRRENYINEWKMQGIKDTNLEILNHMLKENTVLIENMDL